MFRLGVLVSGVFRAEFCACLSLSYILAFVRPRHSGEACHLLRFMLHGLVRRIQMVPEIFGMAKDR